MGCPGLISMHLQSERDYDFTKSVSKRSCPFLCDVSGILRKWYDGTTYYQCGSIMFSDGRKYQSEYCGKRKRSIRILLTPEDIKSLVWRE